MENKSHSVIICLAFLLLSLPTGLKANRSFGDKVLLRDQSEDQHKLFTKSQIFLAAYLSSITNLNDASYWLRLIKKKCGDIKLTNKLNHFRDHDFNYESQNFLKALIKIFNKIKKCEVIPENFLNIKESFIENSKKFIKNYFKLQKYDMTYEGKYLIHSKEVQEKLHGVLQTLMNKISPEKHANRTELLQKLKQMAAVSGVLSSIVKNHEEAAIEEEEDTNTASVPEPEEEQEVGPQITQEPAETQAYEQEDIINEDDNSNNNDDFRANSTDAIDEEEEEGNFLGFNTYSNNNHEEN